MKNCLTFFFALVCFSAAARAQVLILNGHVTGATGIYGPVYDGSSEVKLSLDFTSVPNNLFSGLSPDEGRYLVTGSFTVAGNDVIVFPGVLHYGVGLHDDLLDQPGGEGLFIGTAWNTGSFFQYFLSQQDILSSVTLFPANIPFSDFSRVDGYYANDTPGASGRIDWLITSYTGFAEGVQSSTPPPPISAVPEPATYGIFAALVLLSLAGWRRPGAFRFAKAQSRIKKAAGCG